MIAAMLLGLDLLFSTARQLMFRAAALQSATGPNWGIARQPLLWLGVGCFVVEIGAWIGFVSFVPLSAAVLIGSLNIVTVMLGGRLLFAENMTRERLIAVALIVTGVILVGLGGA